MVFLLCILGLSLLVVVAIACVVALSRHGEEQSIARQRAERKRVEACGEVVLFFANELGYIARQVIDRAELASLIDQGINPEDLARVIGQRIAAAPGLVLGYQAIGGTLLDVKLNDDYRDRHVYVIGKSGSGKTNLLRAMIEQDLEAGDGVAVLAPEQEMLTDELLPYVPEHRLDDVIYLNPADTDRTVPLNPLVLEDGEDLDLKVDDTLTIFKRIMAGSGPRMEELLRQSLYALIGRPGATLLDVERLLDRADPGFRHEIIRTTRDPEVARFWAEGYPSFPKDAHLPITTRLGRFLRPKPVRNLLCIPDRCLSFRNVMDEQRVLLCNLSDGVLGEQNSQLLGQLVVSKLQLATMARADTPKQARVPFHLYCDEFQTFIGTAGVSYEKLLSRARKYRVRLILAHQQTGQLPGDLLREILGNVSTAVCFLVSREDALKFSKEFVTTYDGEVMNIPETELLQLKVGQAYCKMGQHAFFMRTYLMDQRPDREWAKSVIGHSRNSYGMPAVRSTGKGAEAADDSGAAPNARARKRTARPRDDTPTPASPLDDVFEDLDPAKVFDQ